MLPKKAIQNWLGLCGDALVEGFGQALSHLAGVSSADRPAIDLRDRREFTHRAGAKKFVGAIDLGERKITHLVRDITVAAKAEHDLSRDALGTSDQATRRHGAILYNEEVSGVRLGDEAA